MIDCVAGNNTFSHPSFRIQCTFRLQDAISFSPAISAFPIYGQAGENSPNRRHFARRHAAKVGPSTSSIIMYLGPISCGACDIRMIQGCHRLDSLRRRRSAAVIETPGSSWSSSRASLGW